MNIVRWLKQRLRRPVTDDREATAEAKLLRDQMETNRLSQMGGSAAQSYQSGRGTKA